MSDEVGLRVNLLQGFDVLAGGSRIVLPLGCQRLVAVVAVQDRPVRRSTVVRTLWPDSDERRADANLRSTLWRLSPAVRDAVHVGRDVVELDESVSCDVHELVSRARRLREGTGIVEGDLDPSVFLHDLLPSWYDDWVTIERERLRQLRLHALEAVCAALTAAGRYAEAVEAGLAAVAAEPLRESAHRRLIEAHLAEGNTSEALRQFHLYRQLLRQELSLEPSLHLRELLAAATEAAEPG